jgi:UDP-sugar transporter A1/2/3
MPTKYVALIVLVVQNASLALTMRYSRIMPGPRYLTSTAVVLSELIKCVICVLIHLRNEYQAPNQHILSLSLRADDIEPPAERSFSLHHLLHDIFSIESGFPKLLIPAVLYTVQNNLQYVAVSNLDTAMVQVLYQGKILTTALCAVLLLRQKLSWTKWLALLILTMGVICVQHPSQSSDAKADFAQAGSYVVGVTAVITACVCSGLAGVYFEMILKRSQVSIWIRSIQLSVSCLVIALFGAFAWDGRAIREGGCFQGYNTVVLMTILLQAGGGLIVAMVIKYADNILKGFATSLSVILSAVASAFFFDFVITDYFIAGAALVLVATNLYGLPNVEPKVVNKSRDEMQAESELLVGGQELEETGLASGGRTDVLSGTPHELETIGQPR